MTSNKLFGKT